MRRLLWDLRHRFSLLMVVSISVWPPGDPPLTWLPPIHWGSPNKLLSSLLGPYFPSSTGDQSAVVADCIDGNYRIITVMLVRWCQFILFIEELGEFSLPPFIFINFIYIYNNLLVPTLVVIHRDALRRSSLCNIPPHCTVTQTPHRGRLQEEPTL